MSSFFIVCLAISMGNMILGSDLAPVTIVDRCSTDMMVKGARMGSGQEISAELDKDGFDLRNATDGRVLARLALASSAQLNFRGNLNIGRGVNLVIGGRAGAQNFYNAFIDFGQGVFGSLGNDGSNIRFTCNRTTCIYNHLFPKTGNGLVVTFCE